MPEYLAPGVYVEETSYRAKSIEGVSTSTAGFVGPTRTGPLEGKPEVLTSFADFVRTYGGLEDLVLDGTPRTNFMAHAARAFFDEGGSRLYVMRVANGVARASTAFGSGFDLQARAGGAAGAMRVTFDIVVGPNVLLPARGTGAERVAATLARRRPGDVALTAPPAPDDDDEDEAPPASWTLRTVDREGDDWTLTPSPGGGAALDQVAQVRPVSVLVQIAHPTVDGNGAVAYSEPEVLGAFSLSPDAADGLIRSLALAAPSPVPIVLAPKSAFANAATALAALVEALDTDPKLSTVATSPAHDPAGPPTHRPATVDLGTTVAGSDGAGPTSTDYEGNAADPDPPTGLLPSRPSRTSRSSPRHGSTAELTPHVQARPSARSSSPTASACATGWPCSTRPRPLSRSRRPRLSKRDILRPTPRLLPVDHGARPVRRRPSPAARRAASSPASGPATTSSTPSSRRRPTRSIRSALDLEVRLTKGQQDVLNPEGVNCLRFFPGRGHPRLGCPHHQRRPGVEVPVSVRRYFAYLEHSIDRGHAVGGVREQRRRALGERAPHDRGLPLTEWKMRRAAGGRPEGGVLRPLRPLDDDPERPRQRAARLPDRRGGRQARPSSSSSASASGPPRPRPEPKERTAWLSSATTPTATSTSSSTSGPGTRPASAPGSRRSAASTSS